MSLPEYLKKAGIMGIEGIDTRALTRHLRINGAMRGVISTEGSPEQLVQKAKGLPSMEGLNLADVVGAKTTYQWTGTGTRDVSLRDFSWTGSGPRLIVYDFGIKWNILRLLAAQGFDMLVVPSDFTHEQVAELAPDAVFLSNGPGDPAVVTNAIAATRAFADKYPVAGICLGHQIMGLALGGDTYKLKFGHHGCNHPVMDMETGKIEISSQNHGFCVYISKLPELKVTHRNLNDQTLEGFAHREKPLIAIQFHPEAAPGPHDSAYFFRRFRDLVRTHTGK
jgi:carbamoyl-phosphate synthase small subunit